MSNDKPTHELLELCRQGDNLAAEEIFRRYSDRLCGLAESHISARLGRRIEPSDILQSVFRTFFRRTVDGQFSLDHSTSLWHLLVRITLNKLRKQARHHTAQKCDMSVEVYSGEFAESIAREPSPDEVAAFADELEVLVEGLKEQEIQVLRLCLEGYTTSEIGTQIKRTRHTVRRMLDRIGDRLQKRIDDNSEK